MSDGPVAAPFEIKPARRTHELEAVRDLFAAYAADAYYAPTPKGTIFMEVDL